MSLIVDRIKCVEESDEIGSDDIYLLVFRGRTTAPFNTGFASVGPGTPWEDMDTGETHGTDVRLAGRSADSVYAVMMVERDNGKDISGTDTLGAWSAQLDLVWKSVMLGFVAGGLATGSAAAQNAGFTAIRNAMNGLASLYMNFPKGNDDIVNVRRVTTVATGSSQDLRFRSDAEDCTYDVLFRQTAAV